MEENNNPPLTPQQFAQKVKAKYPQYKDVDDVTLAKKMVEKYPEYAKQVSFGDVKKKESSESTSQEKPSVSPTKTTQPSTSLATEEPTRAAASVALGGPTKPFRLANESDLETMQKRGILPPPSELPVIKEEIGGMYDLKTNRPEVKKQFKSKTEKVRLPGQRTAQELSVESKMTDENLKDFVEKFRDDEVTGELGYNNKYKIEQAKLKIRENDLDLEDPYVYFSVQKQKENPDNFIQENYSVKELSDAGINIEDFDGFLNKKGYKDDFIKKKSEGLFEGSGKSSTGYDISLANELAKKRMLDLYIEDKYKRDYLKQDINQDILIATGDIKEKSIQKNQLFDQEKTLAYIENNFPVLTKKLKEKDEENAKLYEEAKKGGTDFFSWDTVSKLGKSGWNSLTDRINQFSATTYDALGADATAEGIRMLDEQEKLLRPNDRGVSYVSGKKVQDNGVNYIVDSKGDIYDADSKIIVTDLFNEQKYKSLVEQSRQGEDDWIFSTQGAAVQTSAVVTDMLFQAALTKGIGTAGSIGSGVRGLASATRGTSRVTSVLNDTSKLLKSIPIEKATGYSMIAQGAMGYSQGYEDTLKAARDAGIDDKEAFELAANAGQRMAVLYSTTGAINPQTNVVDNLFGSKNIIKKAIEQYGKTGKKGFVGYIDDLIKNTPRNLVDFAEEGGKEVIQENIQQVGEIGVNKMTNLDAGQKIMNEVMSGDDFMNTSILSFISSGLISKAKLPTFFRNDAKDDLTSLSVLSKNRDKIDGVLNNLVLKGVFTKDQSEKLKQDVDIYTRNSSKLPKKIAVDIAMPIMRELDKIEKLNEEKKNVDKVFHDDIDSQISSVENKIKDLYKSTAEVITEPVAEATPAVEVTEEVKPTEVTTEVLTEPTAEQQAQDINDGNIVTFEYKNENEIPEVFKDKISSRGEVNGKPIIRVTVAKSLADYELSKSQTTEVKPTEANNVIEALKDVDSTTTALENLDQGLDKISNYDFSKFNFLEDISKAYHKAKADGSNPELVKAVEQLLSKPVIVEEGTTTEANIVPTTVTYNGTEYSKNEAGNWVNNKTGNEVKGIGVKGKALIAALNNISPEEAATEEIAPSDIETTLDEVMTPASSNIKEQISRAKKAISKFLPNVEIVYHNTAESFQAAVGDNSRGFYDAGTKKIHINGSNADKTTVSHEVFHAVVLKYISSDKQATELTNRMFKALAKSLKGNPKLLEDINKFASNYSKEQQSEEKLAEVLGYLASEYETLPDASRNIIKIWLEKIAKMVGIKKFTDQEVVDFMNTIATKVAYGQEITENDVKAINQGVSTYIADPTEINRYQKPTEEKVEVGDHKLSFVKKSDLIDFDSLLKDISNKKQKVWFWVADQLGRGDYTDAVVGEDHYLDAGPSFALDPVNRKKNVIWATGKNEKEVSKLIKDSDYIFIISGSPLKSKLFNKKVIDIVAKRAGDFNSFKKNILKVSKIKPLNTLLSSVDSWEQLRNSPKRKEFLLNVLSQSDKNTPLKKALEKYNSIVDLNELRDGFYADNNFDTNDIMLVLKPTEFGGKSDHSTYENNILGDVVGVPDIKVNAFDILPSEIKDKYKNDLGKSQQQQVVAPYGIGVKPIERRQISPENSSNYANMTEDGKGNFVFFHFGPRGIKFVDPKKYGSNKGAITSRPEIAAMGRVGGMSQFYTMPEFQESNVSGDKYMIKVPMDKVYDFNTDPDNLIGKAKEMFKAKHPDLPFTANDQLAYITKLAEKAGYDMTVAEWNGMSRAQSTKPLTPVDTQVMDGNTISKPFKENYESNASKGFTPVIPTSKEVMLKKVYEDINMERNAKNRYDKLYSLAEDFPKLSQAEITDMIVNSDISQELKDAYNTAVAYEPGTRMSGRRQIDPKAIAQNTKSEVDRVKALPIKAEDGATFNLDGTKYDGGGLVVPLNSIEGNTTQEKLTPEMIGDFAKKNEDSVSDESMVKMGIYKFPGKVDVSVDMNIVIPREHREVALEFGALIGQESLYDLDSNENIKTGGDGLNPMNLTAEQFREAATSLKNGVMPTFVSGRRQKSPIDLAVEAGKRRGFSNKEIADYLVSKGYTRSQATNAILRYDNITAVKLRKKDSVFTKEGRNKIITFLDQVKRRAMSAKSFLPKSVFILKEGIEANIKAEAKRASYLVDDFNKLVKKYNGDLDVLNDEFDKYLRGDQNAILPDEFKAVAGKMRTHIDNLSQMLIKNGVVTLSQAETIAANLGQYINRSYQVFDKKDWAKQVTEEMKEAARVELRNIFKANTGKVPATGISGFDQAFTAKVEQAAAKEGFDVDIVLEKYINEQIDSILNRESAATFLGMGKTGSKNQSIMKEKTDIPLAIRQLMGEYTDASQNYARTILKIATLAENARFLQGVRDAGLGVFFFKDGDLNKPAEFNTQIAGEGSETMSPLNGLYTTKEIADAFKTSISAEKFIEGFVGTNAASTAISLYSGYMKLLSVVKWNKTIASIATHSKNITGNIWFMLSNGYFNYKKYGEAFNVLKNTKDNDLRDKLDEYIRAGIIDQSAALGEIKSMFSDADFETAIENRLKKNPIEKAKKASRWVITKLNTAYQLEDDFYKIVAYESEKARYSNAEFQKPFDQLNDDQKLMVSAIAAENTKNVLPNYARIPGLVKILKVAPITGTFISFQAEAYRTAWNTVALAFDELSSDNKKIKAIGAKRLAGIAFSQSLKFGLMSAIGTVLRGGDDDDEEDKLNKNVREFVPEWSKKSDLTLLDYGKGKFSYVDFSSSDPHGGIKKAYNSFIAGDGAIESFTNGISEILGPFVKKDMLLEAITDINNNENSYGGKLYNESDTNVNKINAVMARIYKVLEPGTITSARKVAEAENVGNELAGQLTGYKVITIDVEQQLGFKMSDSKKKITEGPRRLYNSAFYKFEDKKITAEELEAVYNQANSEQKDIYKTIMNNIKAASFFGVEDDKIDDAMDGLGKDVTNDLWYGEVPDMKQKQIKLTDAEIKKKYGEKVFNQILRGRELIKKGAN